MSEHRENGCSCEEPPDEQPVDLGVVAANAGAAVQWLSLNRAPSFMHQLASDMAEVLVELRQAREDLKGFQEMESEREYCTGNNEPGVPGGPEEPSGLVIPHQTLAGAVTAAEENDRIAYGRSVLYGPWSSTDGYPF